MTRFFSGLIVIGIGVALQTAALTQQETILIRAKADEMPKVRRGELFDLQRYEECHRANARDGSCERYRLTSQDNPEVWPHLQVRPFKWPIAPENSVYVAGMNRVDYWRALCKAEAGEFIYKTVRDVNELYQIRPRLVESAYALQDRYVMEDPYGYVEGEAGKNLLFTFIGPNRRSVFSPPWYAFVETPAIELGIQKFDRNRFHSSIFELPTHGERYQRFFGYTRKDRRTLQMEYIGQPSSRYGFTWRGISRVNDRELGIAGGEVAVVDLETNETLAIRRGFVLASSAERGALSWLTGNACPEYSQLEGLGKVRQRNKDFDFTLWFLTKVIVPTDAPRD